MEGTTIPAALVGVWEGAMVEAAQSWPLRATRGLVSGARQRVDNSDSVWLCGESDRRHVSDLRLDLTHRPTRLEVRVRLAERMGHVGTIAAIVPRATGWWLEMLGDAWSRLDVPALADLDPTDDTRLPDGARVVDVRALAIVCQHVFGGAS